MGFPKNIHKILVFCLLLLAGPVFADTANITDLVFTTSNFSVSVGEVSDEITVQTQNSSGSSEKISETNDIEFKSDSSSGEFLGGTGNPVTTTMSKNTSSRTFYYRDTTSGTHNITIKITGRESGKTFSASQAITVGSQGSTYTQDDSSVSGGSGNTKSTATAGESALIQSQDFKTDIGKSRMVAINTPVYFEELRSAGARSNTNSKFYWSFGDGTSGRGRVINHVYSYPGDYVIVLNAKQGGLKSVSRTEVKVVAPDIKITSVQNGISGFVEIKNNSPYEVNIGAWTLTNSKEYFVVASDTIIKSKSSIRLPFASRDASVSLKYPTGNIAVSFKGDDDSVALADKRTEMLKNLVLMKKELELKKTQFTPAETLETITPQDGAKTEVPQTDQSATLLNAFEKDKSESSGIKNKVVNFFRSLFSN